MPDLLLRDTNRDELIYAITASVVRELRPLLEQSSHPRLVDGDEMARLLGISRPTLDRLRSVGKVPSLKVGTRRLYRPDAVVAALAAADEKGVADE